MTRPERLAEFYRRLQAQPPSTTAENALARVRDTLDEVEDAFSGIPKSDPPPPPGQLDGRMYPPLDDYIRRLADGGIKARTQGHDIRIGPDGRITIKKRTTGQVEFQQPGGRK